MATTKPDEKRMTGLAGQAVAHGGKFKLGTLRIEPQLLRDYSDNELFVFLKTHLEANRKYECLVRNKRRVISRIYLRPGVNILCSTSIDFAITEVGYFRV